MVEVGRLEDADDGGPAVQVQYGSGTSAVVKAFIVGGQTGGAQMTDDASVPLRVLTLA